ncbi:MATE family efflux transporter [Caldisalinibacter kiritimatiensis]|uniref:Multi antimicrobial extrusion protein MatE n=1 Tax=Caldisalinibacter kiritimatiensis TaxID=1304284 RepID=R1AWZ4_9FIRM|nr:MATE family efflux transporter [Caldisalinibacter kiritimatiensis]EOD01177.1 Multi antimicrobial extrusion protein MatE [Caldisalinibacter kiritimatiensis]
MNQILRDKKFYKTMLSIALPVALQNLISSSLNMVDTVMIQRLGDSHLAAVGMANQFFFLFVLLLFGINSGASIFVSQFWGKKDILNIRRVLGISLITGGALSIIFMSGALFTPRFIMGIFTEDIKVIGLGQKYLTIVGFSYIVTAISFSYGFSSRSIGQAKTPMIVSALSLATNTLLNYGLIFGNFGFPMLGIRGAAIATLISRTLEVLLLTGTIYINKGVLAGKINEMIDISKQFVIRFFKTTMPVILNEAFWSLGITMYFIAYGRIGTEAFAAVQIANTIQNMFMVVSMGLGNACAVMIGNEIGAENEEKAIQYAKKYSILAPAVGVILGLSLFLLSPFILRLFNTSPHMYQNAYRTLIVISIFMSFKMFNTVLVVGILRGGGDTKYSLFLEMGSVWGVGVPLAFIGALYWRLPIYLVVALVSIEEVVKSSIGIPRIISKKWVRNVVRHL